MSQTKVFTVNRQRILSLAQFAILVGIATIAPLFHQQAIVGPIVNAVLFVSVTILSVQSAILVGLVPSLIALSFGLLPPVLAPMVPFIMIANTLMILTFYYLRNRNYWLRVTVASVAKFLLLFFTSSIVINLLLQKEIAQKVAAMMSWPQLFTALAGGLIAYFILRGVKKIK